MFRLQLRTAAITVAPLAVTAVAMWATGAAYEAHLFDNLSYAKNGAFLSMVAIHIFAPIWAGTRPSWIDAAFAQLGLVAVNSYFFLQLALTRPHDYVEVSRCGLGGAFLCLGVIVGFIVYAPIALIWARSLHRRLAL